MSSSRFESIETSYRYPDDSPNEQATKLWRRFFENIEEMAVNADWAIWTLVSNPGYVLIWPGAFSDQEFGEAPFMIEGPIAGTSEISTRIRNEHPQENEHLKLLKELQSDLEAKYRSAILETFHSTEISRLRERFWLV